MSHLVLAGVSKARGQGRQRVQALSAVDLRLDAGELVLLEGPSGSGKTTLLSIAAGLLSPDQGTVSLSGQDLAALTPRARRALRARHVGFVFQRANLLMALDVRENVALAGALAGLPRARALAETDRLLTVLGIADLAERSPRRLSGGEEHRVAVARALVHAPAVILADEPTGNLDSASGRSVAEALRALARDSAVLVATHDARLHEFATRRLWIEDGRLVEAS